MNRPVQDAILGRFLSPDPIIQDSSNAQNYNRYSYVINNPLTFTDPSGYVCLLLGAVAPCDASGPTPADTQSGVTYTIDSNTGDINLEATVTAPAETGDDDGGGPSSAPDPSGGPEPSPATPQPAPSPQQGPGGGPAGTPKAKPGSQSQTQSNSKNPCPDAPPPVVITAQQGTFAKFGSDLFGWLSSDVSIDLGSYNTPSSGSPYWSHGVGLSVGVGGAFKVGFSYQQTSSDGGLSFVSSPTNFNFMSLNASNEGLSVELAPPQAFSGFTVTGNMAQAPTACSKLTTAGPSSN